MKRNEKKGTGKVLIPALIAMPILTILLSLAGAKLVLSGSLKQETMGVVAYVITALVSFILSAYAALRMPQKKMLWGLGAAGVYFIMLLLSNLLFFGEGFGGILPILGCTLGAGAFGGFAGAGKRKKYA